MPQYNSQALENEAPSREAPASTAASNPVVPVASTGTARTEVTRVVSEILSRASDRRRAAEDVVPDLRLKDDLGVDSLKFITVMLDIEEELDRHIFKVENIPCIITVGDLLALVAVVPS